jgi:hypothetical protein
VGFSTGTSRSEPSLFSPPLLLPFALQKKHMIRFRFVLSIFSPLRAKHVRAIFCLFSIFTVVSECSRKHNSHMRNYIIDKMPAMFLGSENGVSI